MLKVGVFGVGHLGKFHLNNLKEIEGVELVGFYDPNDATAKAVEEKYHLQRFSSINSLLEKIDAVDVVAPTVGQSFGVAQGARSRPVSRLIHSQDPIVRVDRSGNRNAIQARQNRSEARRVRVQCRKRDGE